jgi:hypothetical protein
MKRLRFLFVLFGEIVCLFGSSVKLFVEFVEVGEKEGILVSGF